MVLLRCWTQCYGNALRCSSTWRKLPWGGKFSLIGSVIGAYTIQALTTTLYAMNVKADQLPVYKAIVVVIIVTLQSDVFKKYIAGLKAKKSVAVEGGQK